MYTRILRLYFSNNVPITARLSHQLAVASSNSESFYPAIYDASKEGLNAYHRQKWYDSIKALPTAEQKLYEIAMQQRLNLKIYRVSSVASTYVGVPFHSYITRTHIIHGLPEKIQLMNVDDELNEIRTVFCDSLLHYYNNIWRETNYDHLDKYLLEKNAGIDLLKILITQCFRKLSSRNDYILESAVHSECRIESFWWHQGFESEKNRLYEKNLCFQFMEHVPFVIRIKKPLSPILEMHDPLCSTPEVPNYHYHPKVCGISSRSPYVVSVPGFWPGDPCDFPLLLALPRSKFHKLLSKTEKYNMTKIEDCAGVMSSFGWTNAIAQYQGFTPFHDVTYPIVCQTVLTNGQDWNFFVYQLNTMAFHSDVDRKDRRNICWSSGRLRLFETIENGKVKGMDDEVFRILLKFLHNAPVLKDSLNLNPYLGVDNRSEEEKQNDRRWIRQMYSRKPHPRQDSLHVPVWQRIYKFHKDAPPCPFVRMQ